MNDMITPQALLKRAATIIAERGWYQGHFIDEQGCSVCAHGALNLAYAEAAGFTGDASGAYGSEWHGYPGPEPLGQAVDALLAVIGDPDSIADWNDDEDRTEEEVVAAFHRAASKGGESK